MNKIFIETINAPDTIKAQLKVLSKDILFNREITKGGNGYIFFGQNNILNTAVAVKFYYWGGNHAYHVEPKTLAAVKSPNILSVQNAGLTDGSWAYFVTTHCIDGDLDDLIEKTDFGNIKAIDRTSQILIGVGALHESRFLHRDLKPANIYIGETGQSVIGDFGSIQFMPNGRTTIPASGHAVLYRPPESVVTNSYGFEGDIYQCGIILYQLLGGFLPYDGMSWLNKAETQAHDAISNGTDRSIYIDDCIKSKITNGKIINMSSLPPWVPDVLKRTIRKATHIDPAKRFQNASAFHVHLNNIRATVPNWEIREGVPHLHGKNSYRILEDKDGNRYVEKSKDQVRWRRDNYFDKQSMAELVEQINQKAQH